MKTAIQFVLLLIFFAAMVLAVAWLEAGNQSELSGHPVVIDGDSMEIDGERVRLLGIDAPELNQICRRGDSRWSCGRDSRAALRGLVKGGSVSCLTSGIDKYDRWLVECAVNGRSVNESMVRQGWAIAYGGYHHAEEAARSKGVGIWSGNFERPKQWRDAHRGDLGNRDTSIFRTAWTRMKRLAKSMLGL